MKPRITRIKGVDKGTAIPADIVDSGGVGRFIEKQLEKHGHNYNTGKGIDLPELNVENKSRKVGSKSAHTVGRMTTNDIINTSWENSSIREKIQALQNRYEWNDTFGEITNNSLYDFTDPDIDVILKSGYELGRQEIASGMCGNNTKTYGAIIWQKDKDKEQWQYRITEKGMRQIKNMAKQTSYRKLFEEGKDGKDD